MIEKKMLNIKMLASVYVLLCFTCSLASKPNIVIFLADDLGIGDIGIYGNTTLKTPNIDRVGKEGVKLEHHVAADSACTPSRAALLTGRYPIRTGMSNTKIRVMKMLASTAGLPPDEITFAEQAKMVGYHTCLIGKWHLGVFDIWRNPVHHPMNQGFDEFYGLPFTNTKDFGNAGFIFTSGWSITPQIVLLYLVFIAPLVYLYKSSYYSNRWMQACFVVFTLLYSCHYLNLYYCMTFNSVLMRGHEVIEQPFRVKGLTFRLVRESVNYLERRRLDNTPFLLYVTWHHMHRFLDPARKNAGKTAYGVYGDCVEEMDWGVGEILNALDQFGFSNNTLVYFASDHGGNIEQAVYKNGGYNGIFKGGKGWGGVEGSIRVAGLIRWPEHIPANTVISEPTSLMDIFPTLSNIMGSPLPMDRHLDGRDILPLIKGEQVITPHEYIMHYCGTELHAVTYRPRNGTKVWKIAYRFPDIGAKSTFSCEFSKPRDPALLFDLSSDPSESHPVNTQFDAKFLEILQTVNIAAYAHKKTLERKEMILVPITNTWMPHLQMCCNFPLCRCQEPGYSDQDLE